MRTIIEREDVRVGAITCTKLTMTGESISSYSSCPPAVVCMAVNLLYGDSSPIEVKGLILDASCNITVMRESSAQLQSSKLGPWGGGSLELRSKGVCERDRYWDYMNFDAGGVDFYSIEGIGTVEIVICITYDGAGVLWYNCIEQFDNLELLTVVLGTGENGAWT